MVHVSLQASVPAFVGATVTSGLFQGGFVHCLKWFRRRGRVPAFGPDIPQNSLSCAPCCAALSLGTIPINESAASAPAGKGTADDRHPSELSSTCCVCRGRQPDRFGIADRAIPGRFPAAGPGKALGL